MDRVEIGATGVRLSRVGLGGYELGAEQADVAGARAVIAAAAGQGINWVDTAEDYHENRNEDVIGAALAGLPERPLIASKVRPNNGGFRPARVHAACRASISRLGVEAL